MVDVEFHIKVSKLLDKADNRALGTRFLLEEKYANIL
jgi:hypothetical protein